MRVRSSIPAPRCASRRIHADASAAHTAHSTLVEPDPARMSPPPVIHSPSGMVATMIAMGRIMLTARGGMRVVGSGERTEGSSSGFASGQRSSPPSVRASARRMPPRESPVNATIPASTTAPSAYRFRGIARTIVPSGSATPSPMSSARMYAPHAFSGISTQTGAEVESMMYASFSRETR